MQISSAERQVGAFLHKLFKLAPSRPIRSQALGLLLDKLCGLVPELQCFFVREYRRDELTLDCICTAAVGA